MTEAGGPLVARAARLVSEATMVAFRNKLTHEQFAMFELATAMADVETAVALAKVAAKKGDPLTLGQSRVWASEIAVGVPVRILKMMSATAMVDPADLATLHQLGNLSQAIADQAGRLADMNFIAQAITAR